MKLRSDKESKYESVFLYTRGDTYKIKIGVSDGIFDLFDLDTPLESDVDVLNKFCEDAEMGVILLLEERDR
jgi:hypothetical protein